VGICGSDLHAYRLGPAEDAGPPTPLILGHEFAGVVQQVGDDAVDGQGRRLRPGMRVAVDPAHACSRCEWCRRGDPNLCPHIQFFGLLPTDGALCRWIHVRAEDCFALPETIDATTAALLEPLGVAIHTCDLAKVRLGENVAVVGLGTIGLCVLGLLVSGHAAAVFGADPLPWRAERAAQLGATAAFGHGGPKNVDSVLNATGQRGVDVAIEAANGGEALGQAAAMLAPGGRLIVVGIDPDDRFLIRHSAGRRKGLTIRFVRRMKHAYPRAIRLVERGDGPWADLVTHRFPLERAPEAFAINADYRDDVIKVMIDVGA
jgi:L-iditol 2-dehydrogenase